MKKLLSTITLIILSLSVMFSASGCITLYIREPSDEATNSEYESNYTYDDTHHWFNKINGDEKKDYAPHENGSGTNFGKCKCGYYFPCHNLVYTKKTINGVLGYEVTDYDEVMSPNFYHVEVPKTYQGEGDAEPLPVLSIAQYALSNRDSDYGKCGIKLESIKLNEGLAYIGVGAFCYSNIEEIVVPDSVVGPLKYTFMYCSKLKKIVIGDGVTLIQGYTFCNSNLLEEVILGSSVEEIEPNNFIGNNQLKRIVIPSSLISIPEGIMYDNNVAGQPIIKMFSNDPDIFFEISEEEYENLIIPRKNRDPLTGRPISPETDDYTHYGFVEGWDGISQKYFVGEWHYDENGTPTPN